MNCCGCLPNAGMTPGSVTYGLSPCLTVYDFKLLDNQAQIAVPVDGIYELSVANFGADVNTAAAGGTGTNYAIVPLQAGSPLYIDYSSGTVAYQGDVVVSSSEVLGNGEYRQGVKLRLVGGAVQERIPAFTKLSLALDQDSIWRDTVFNNGQTMLTMSGNQAVVPTRFGNWEAYPTDSRQVVIADVYVETAGDYTLYGLSRTTLGITVNNSRVKALTDNTTGAYTGYGPVTATIGLSAGHNRVVLQNSNATGKPTEMFVSFAVADSTGKVIATPQQVTASYERVNDCTGNDSPAPSMKCWYYDMTPKTGATTQKITLTTPGWYQLMVAASGQQLDTGIASNTGQGLAVFSAESGDVVSVAFGNIVVGTLPDQSVVESLAGDGTGNGSARVVFLGQTKDVSKTYSKPINDRPSWRDVNIDSRMKFTQIVSGFPDMGKVPGNTAMYLIGSVTLDAGTYTATTWGDDVSVVFFDGHQIDRSFGYPSASLNDPVWGKWQGWDSAIREFTVTNSGTHQIVIFNMNIPNNTPGWSAFTIQDADGKVVHEVNTDYFGLNTIYDCSATTGD